MSALTQWRISAEIHLRWLWDSTRGGCTMMRGVEWFDTATPHKYVSCCCFRTWAFLYIQKLCVTFRSIWCWNAGEQNQYILLYIYIYQFISMLLYCVRITQTPFNGCIYKKTPTVGARTQRWLIFFETKWWRRPDALGFTTIYDALTACNSFPSHSINIRVYSAITSLAHIFTQTQRMPVFAALDMLLSFNANNLYTESDTNYYHFLVVASALTRNHNSNAYMQARCYNETASTKCSARVWSEQGPSAVCVRTY